MARARSVWGIDIGQSALKALRCRYVPETGRLQADAFAFIEYPKILSQPDAEPVELVREALSQFVSRHSVKGDKVALSVSGQNGLAKFIKLPPVEPKKIPDIVKYEAKQQIPFDLKDVIWDYQQLSGGSSEGGYSTDTEVGLFAMKRDQVYRALAPLQAAKIEVDLVQLSPLAVFNALLFDQKELLGDGTESTVIVSMGTDTTDLVITNGQRVWQRSIPTGGSAFTKALTKEMKLTFAKAEHLKRNVAQSPDGKAAMAAMKNTFQDFASEINRSLNYYRNIDKKASITRFVGLGNPFRLPTLQKFLASQLEKPFDVITNFSRMDGAEVVNDPTFQANLASFAVCYGLVAQGVGQSRVFTNLVPKELVADRMIREKKPWAVAGLAAVMIGCMANYYLSNQAFATTQQEGFSTAMSNAQTFATKHAAVQKEITDRKDMLVKLRQDGAALVGNTEGRLNWLELYKAIMAALPVEPPPAPGPNGEPPTPKPLSEKSTLFITAVDAKQFGGASGGGEGEATSTGAADLAEWWTSTKIPLNVAGPMGGNGSESTTEAEGGEGELVEEPVADATAANADASAAGPTGPGWVVQISGYHFHNKDPNNRAAEYIRRTLVQNLKTGKIMLPTNEGDGMEEVSMEELGISFPILRHSMRPQPVIMTDPAKLASDTVILQKAMAEPDQAPPTFGKASDGTPLAAGQVEELRCDFIVQFAWKPTPRTERLRLKAEKAKAAAEGGGADGDSTEPADAPAETQGADEA